MMAISLAIMMAGSVMAAVGGAFLWVITGRALQGFSHHRNRIGKRLEQSRPIHRYLHVKCCSGQS
ncbi:hypothetical protein [Arthrobacter sp. TS-15]|uniref:hypothetical protein n=1 Tax=Arthrobacter sp. TS-15 TaxID=2510797 RepID=UPI001EE96405|nr:hypothetical protein [Arthrobacter sp. TS-15]